MRCFGSAAAVRPCETGAVCAFAAGVVRNDRAQGSRLPPPPHNRPARAGGRRHGSRARPSPASPPGAEGPRTGEPACGRDLVAMGSRSGCARPESGGMPAFRQPPTRAWLRPESGWLPHASGALVRAWLRPPMARRRTRCPAVSYTGVAAPGERSGRGAPPASAAEVTAHGKRERRVCVSSGLVRWPGGPGKREPCVRCERLRSGGACPGRLRARHDTVARR